MLSFAMLLILVGVPLAVLVVQIQDSFPGAERRQQARRNRRIAREARRQCVGLDAEYVQLVRRKGRR